MDPASVDISTTARAPSARTPEIDREQLKIEFYRTYDVMTGIRIAGTLGGFFALMVILVFYKSKSKTEKVLTNPRLAAAVVEAEEERQLNAALEATAEYRCLNPRGVGARRSLGNASIPCASRYTRFSSVGDRGSFLAPIPVARPPQHRLLLEVPDGDSAIRRVSNATTTYSSSESSYLERRDSAVGLHQHRARRRTSSPIPWDLSYPIDIRVIQPTPGGSPCGSERTLHAAAHRLAPLASISSCASSLAVDYPDLDARSLGSDSVFLDDEECLDTDDEITQFSTDSDTDTLPGCPVVPMSELLGKPSSSLDVEEGSWSQETLF